MNKTILVVLAFALFSFGCISINTNHFQLADGSAMVTQVMDMSEYMELAMAQEENSNSSEGLEFNAQEEFESMCDDVPDEVKCELNSDDWTITMSKLFSSDEAFYTFEIDNSTEKFKYTLTVDEMPNLGNQESSDGESLPTKITGEDSKEAAQGLALMGIEWTYNVTMPGTITFAPNGKVSEDNKSVVFDVVELMEEEEPIVVKSEANKPSLNCNSAFIVVGILGLAFYIRRE